MRLAVLTPDPAERRYDGRWPQAFGVLKALFADLGVAAEPTPWTAPPPEADAQLAQLAWGYHRDPDRWAARLEQPGPPMINPAAVLRWNTRKTYLAALGEAGAPVVPTVFERPSRAVVEAACDRFGTGELVVKPQVSAGSHQTVRLCRDAVLPECPAGPMMIQPFLPAIGEEGELSLFFFGGRFSHGARKVAAEGDFRIQPQFGGRFSLFEPDAEALAAADAVLAAAARVAPGPLTYARVDLIRGLDGRLALMELEAIEPDLYLDLAPGGGAAFARAVVATMGAV